MGIEEDQNEISLMDLLIAAGEEKGLIAGIAGLATLAGLVVSLLLTPIFTARTSLLPPQQNHGASSAISASLGALAGLGGIAKAPEELYVGLLKSDSVARAVNERFKLQDRYEVKTFDDLRKELGKNVRASADRKSTLISVEVDDKDPQFAATLGNAYVEELRNLMSRIAVTEAQQRRVYFEQQMVKAKDELTKAEFAVKQSQETGGLVSVDAQTQALIGAAAQLRGQIIAKEVQLQALRPSSGPENPELRRLLAELQSLRAQMGKLEGGTDAAQGSAKNSTEGLGNVRLYRELKYQEAVYAAMLQQFQLAKADEAKDAPLIQQVDVARAPERKSKPSRALVVVVSALAGLILGLIGAFVRRSLREAVAHPESSAHLSKLVRAWAWRKQ